jgi:hypothetical protein
VRPSLRILYRRVWHGGPHAAAPTVVGDDVATATITARLAPVYVSDDEGLCHVRASIGGVDSNPWQRLINETQTATTSRRTASTSQPAARCIDFDVIYNDDKFTVRVSEADTVGGCLALTHLSQSSTQLCSNKNAHNVLVRVVYI